MSAIKKGLTVLSFGGGQDSTTILVKMITDPNYKKRYAANHFIVVMADTGNEHDSTYQHVEEVRWLCSENHVPFYLIKSSDGFHNRSWPDLLTPQERLGGGEFKPTMVQLGTKSCTDKLKLVPIYKFLDEYIAKQMGYKLKTSKHRGHNKQAIKRYGLEVGPINILIGYSKGEEKRVKKTMDLENRQVDDPKDNWAKNLRRRFPLVDYGINRQKCQEINDKFFGYEVMPSNCMLCPYQSDFELEWLRRNRPDMMMRWFEIEDRKLMREQRKEKNYGVYCNKTKTLRDQFKEAEEKYKNHSNQWLHQQKKSHGCQTNIM